MGEAMLESSQQYWYFKNQLVRSETKPKEGKEVGVNVDALRKEIIGAIVKKYSYLETDNLRLPSKLPVIDALLLEACNEWNLHQNWKGEGEEEARSSRLASLITNNHGNIISAIFTPIPTVEKDVEALQNKAGGFKVIMNEGMLVGMLSHKPAKMVRSVESQAKDIIQVLEANFSLKFEYTGGLYFREMFQKVIKGHSGIRGDVFNDHFIGFIEAFQAAKGNKELLDQSLLTTPHFIAAVRMHISDPENSKALLNKLHRDGKPYKPAELCKAYVTCMKDIQEYRQYMPDFHKTQADKQINKYIDSASNFIKDGKIDNKSLQGSRDIIKVDSNFIMTPKKVNLTVFAFHFKKEFPALEKTLEDIVKEQHPNKFNKSNDKENQNLIDKEVKKLVEGLTNKLQSYAGKHGQQFNAYRELSILNHDTKERGEKGTKYISELLEANKLIKPKPKAEEQHKADGKFQNIINVDSGKGHERR